MSSDDYYRGINTRDHALGRDYLIGQLCWAPCQYEFDPLTGYILRSKYVEQSGSYAYSVGKVRLPGEFDTDSLDDLNFDLGIEAKERALLVFAKYRPVIIISQAPAPLQAGNRQFPPTYLIAPIYSFGGGNKRSPYPPAVREKMKGYLLPQTFYLPKSAEIEEGFVRLDRIQAVAAHQDWLKPMRIQLSDDAMWLLRSWIRVYWGEELDTVNDILFEYREAAITDLRSKGLI